MAPSAAVDFVVRVDTPMAPSAPASMMMYMFDFFMVQLFQLLIFLVAGHLAGGMIGMIVIAGASGECEHHRKSSDKRDKND